jgi:uncharacterized DUF497 family protein
MPSHVGCDFEWDCAKSDRSFARWGFDFQFASRIFASESYVEAIDERHSDDEARYIAIGIVDGPFITVIYTPRKNRKRILSARRSTKTETDEYAKAFGYEQSWKSRLE